MIQAIVFDYLGVLVADDGRPFREMEAVTRNDILLAYIRETLKPTYKIGLLTNIALNDSNRLFSPEDAAVFDVVALSSQTGFIKPDLRAYQEIAGRLEVAPQACVFVDDKEGHCVGAREAGMQAVRYESFEQMKQALEGILSASREILVKEE